MRLDLVQSSYSRPVELVGGGFEPAVGSLDGRPLGIERLPESRSSGDESEESQVLVGIEIEGFSHLGGAAAFVSEGTRLAASGGGADDLLAAFAFGIGAILDQGESGSGASVVPLLVYEQLVPDLGFALGVSGIEGDDGSDAILGISLIDGLVVVGPVHGRGLNGEFGMQLLGVFEQGDSLGVVWDFSGGDDHFDGEVGVDVYDEMDLVSEEGVGLGLMSPLGIGVGVFSEALALAGAVADLDAELVGAGPDVGGIHGGVDLLLDQACGDGLCDELMEDGIEGVLSQSGAELGEGCVGGGVEEVEATEELESDVELELVRQISFGGGFSHIAQQLCFEHADGGIGFCPLVGVEMVGQSGDEAPVNGLEGVVDGVVGMELRLGEDIDRPGEAAGDFEHRIPPEQGCRWIERCSVPP